VYTSNYNRRAKAVFFIFVIFFLICSARLFFVQCFHSEYLKSLANRQHNLLVELEPRRGTIFDANLRPQAVNLAVDSLYACPIELSEIEKEDIVRKLPPVLAVSRSFLEERLSRKKYFVWLARKLTTAQAEAIKQLKLRGLGFIKESKRSYPNNYLASHLIGFAGLDNRGLEDIELYYDKYLRGEAGWALVLRDARQNRLNFYENMMQPKDGYDLVLTIDEVIQYIAERELDKAYTMYYAKGASIVVLEPDTGKVLALANRPSVDLNTYATSTTDLLRNRAICDLFEPGSVFKIVTASAALEEGKFTEEDKIFCENGSYKLANHILHDHRPHGMLTFREVIEQSSNIGVSKIAQALGSDTIYKYIRLFGFGSKAGIDLPGEIVGMIKEPRQWSKTSIGAVPMGQEVGVTALQLASAISAIANGGLLMKPYVVEEIRDKSGQPIKQFSPVEVRRVISEETAARIRSILTGVVENGTGKLAKFGDCSVAGKTGTAQKIEANGTYSHDKFYASFIGFAPADKPVVAIVVVLDEPRPYYFGGVVAAPVFKNVARDALRYLKSNQMFFANNTLVFNDAGRTH
jgi:cell division protein FtsI (penicillin-binding protein 3)